MAAGDRDEPEAAHQPGAVAVVGLRDGHRDQEPDEEGAEREGEQGEPELRAGTRQPGEAPQPRPLRQRRRT